MPIEVRELTIKARVDADSFDFKAKAGENGTEYTVRMKDLLVSSYQTGGSTDGADSFDITATTGDEETQIGLLLPAVQKVREAAAVEEPDMDLTAGRDDGETKGSIPIFPEYDDYAHKKYPPSSSSTAADDVIVDGNIITAENYDSMF